MFPAGALNVLPLPELLTFVVAICSDAAEKSFVEAFAPFSTKAFVNVDAVAFDTYWTAAVVLLLQKKEEKTCFFEVQDF